MKSIAVIENILNELLLCDIWRVRNPNRSQYTWKTFNPLVQRRLDYFFVSNDLQLNVNKSEILTSISTDHSAISLQLKPCDQEPNGPSHWKFNSSLIDDHDYVKLIKEKIPIWKSEYHSKDPRELWEYLKFSIRLFTIKYSKEKAKKFKSDLKELEEKIKILEKSLDMNLEEYLTTKQNIEKFYDKLAEGSIVRSKTQWYEEGEKSTKYFLNLEKHNKAKLKVA